MNRVACFHKTRNHLRVFEPQDDASGVRPSERIREEKERERERREREREAAGLQAR